MHFWYIFVQLSVDRNAAVEYSCSCTVLDTTVLDTALLKWGLYHCRQCSIVLKPRSVGLNYTVVCFTTHDCSSKLTEKVPLQAKYSTDLVGAQGGFVATARARAQPAVVALVADAVSELGLVADLADGVVTEPRGLRRARYDASLLLQLLLLLMRLLVQFLHRSLVVLEVVLQVPATGIHSTSLSLSLSQTNSYFMACFCHLGYL